MEEVPIETEVLIIGAGLSGCRAAMEAHDYGANVLMVTKGVFGRDCAATWMAACGFQCWGIYPHDTLDVHVEDTLRCGWFLNNQENVYAFLKDVPKHAWELVKWGGRYRMKKGKFLPIWQLGCSTVAGRSIVCWQLMSLGYNYQNIVPRQIRTRNINVMEDIFISDLLTKGNTVVGAVGIDIKTGEFKVFKAKSIILATGGYEGCFPVTTANPFLTGDGQGMALRAGVDMMDFEFMQTLPCCIWPPALKGDLTPFYLILNFGAHWYNSDGERFMRKYDLVKLERSTRAIISRAIYHEVKAGRGSPHGGIYTSVAHLPESFIEEKMRAFERGREFLKLKEAGIDLRKDYVETSYAVHYTQGGCDVNEKCETDKTGLYAVGEVASGSKDGADRMMSNALPYCMAMGCIAGREAAERSKMVEMPEIDDKQVKEFRKKIFASLDREEGIRVYEVKPLIIDFFGRETIYGRTKEGLKSFIDEIERYKKEVMPKLWIPNKSKKFNLEWINVLEFENIMLIAECVAKNALMRTESRGLHDRLDYPEPDSNWFKNIHLRMVDGKIKQWTVPVNFTYWEPEPGSLGEPMKRGVKVREYHG